MASLEKLAKTIKGSLLNKNRNRVTICYEVYDVDYNYAPKTLNNRWGKPATMIIFLTKLIYGGNYI